MPRPISDEELQLKKRARRRLVGAVVLVTAVAVVLPMVLDSEPKPVTQNVDIQIPSPDSGEFKPKAAAPAPAVSTTPPGAPLRGMPAGSQAPSVTSKDAPKSTSPSTDASGKGAATTGITEIKSGAGDSSSEPARSAAKDAATDDAKGAAKDSATNASRDAPASGFVIQVEALADPSKARRLQEKVAGTGLKSYTEVVATKGGELTRVRAGPYPTREAAEKARTQLKKAGLDGKVVPK